MSAMDKEKSHLWLLRFKISIKYHSQKNRKPMTVAIRPRSQSDYKQPIKKKTNHIVFSCNLSLFWFSVITINKCLLDFVRLSVRDSIFEEWLNRFPWISVSNMSCSHLDFMLYGFPNNFLNKRYGHAAYTFSRLIPIVQIWEIYYYKQWISYD